jgi:MtrB/PioB family decaheme-associated outer membrane protein
MNKHFVHRISVIFMILLVFVSISPLNINAAEEKAISGYFDTGVRSTTIDGDKAKFLEYRDLDSGFFLDELQLKYAPPAGSTYFDLSIKNLNQEDEFYGLEGGKYGTYKYRLFYDSIPHTYGTGRSIFSGFGSNYLSIPDPVQQGLEAVEQTRGERGVNDPFADTSTEDAAAQDLVNGLFGNAADPATFKVIRKKSGFEYEYSFPSELKAWLKVSNERRNGTKVISTGTYERFAQTPGFTPVAGNTIASVGTGPGGTHTADLFLVSGAELAEPIDYITTSVSAGTGIYRKNWLADVQYTFTDFKNEFSSLRWDNPFRISDATATTSGDAVVDETSNGFNRGRFATGQLALPPDSQSHEVNASGSVTLPMHGRVTVALGYGLITQDEAFLPYTLNSAVSGTGGAPAVDLTDPSVLPAHDLNGEVQTLSGSTVLTFKPADPLAVTAKYRYYRYDDQSSHIQFPGYVAFGESFWRTKRNDPGVNNVRNEPFSFTKQVVDLGLDFHMTRSLTAFVEGGWEGWDYANLRVEDSDEYIYSAGILFRPSRTSSLKVAYTIADRNVDGYEEGATAENPEAVGLVNYNWADRERNKVEARYQVMPSEPVTIGLIGWYYEDDYAEDSRFGLKKVKDWSAALDVAYAHSEVLTLYTNYSREYRKDFIQNGAKDDPFDIDPSTLDEPFLENAFNPFNYWNTDIKDTVNSVGVGARFHLIPRKLAFEAGYSFSYGKTKFDNYNPNAAAAQAALAQDAKLANAVATDWPDVTNRLHEVTASVTYAVTQNLSASLRYLYEWYRLTDFSWDPMSNYLAGQTAENSTRFVFMDPTYHKYEAQVASVNLIYTF